MHVDSSDEDLMHSSTLLQPQDQISWDDSTSSRQPLLLHSKPIAFLDSVSSCAGRLDYCCLGLTSNIRFLDELRYKITKIADNRWATNQEQITSHAIVMLPTILSWLGTVVYFSSFFKQIQCCHISVLMMRHKRRDHSHDYISSIVFEPNLKQKMMSCTTCVLEMVLSLILFFLQLWKYGLIHKRQH